MGNIGVGFDVLGLALERPGDEVWARRREDDGVALLAVERSVRRAFEACIPLVGMVENMSSTVCRRCGDVAPLFHEVSVEERAREMGLELLARIPFDPDLAAATDAGEPFLLGSGATSRAGLALAELARRVRSFELPEREAEPR